MKKILRKTKGITLIALVITIVVLLILATISISFITGQNGLILRTKNAAEKYEVAGVEEDQAMTEASQYIDEEISNSSETKNPSQTDKNPKTDLATKLESINTVGIRKITHQSILVNIKNPTETRWRYTYNIQAIIQNNGKYYLEMVNWNYDKSEFETGEITVCASPTIEETLNYKFLKLNPDNTKYDLYTNLMKYNGTIYERHSNWTYNFEGNISQIDEFVVKHEEYTSSPIKLTMSSGSTGTVILPVNSKNFIGTVEWGDGTTTTYDNVREYSSDTDNTKTMDVSHKYSANNTNYKVSINGICNALNSSNMGSQKAQLITVDDWGKTELAEVKLKSCTELTSVASPNSESFKKLASVDETFLNCKNLTSIPADFLSNCPNLIDVAELFGNCVKLSEIPENLFENCTNIFDISYTFAVCNAVKSIPAGLLKNCTKLVYAEGTFFNLYKVTTVPDTLFDTCKNIQEYSKTFAYCYGLTTAPALWNKGTNNADNKYNGNPNGASCYCDCTKMSNYSSIPAYWKQK